MSSYLVLARKYRPRTFPEVIGQDVVTGVLEGALREGRLGHAYLFCGPRGTGKTTLARIFAKCLNCEKGPTASPCGTCERCLGAEASSEVDVIELDAASHTGIDTIRELRDEAIYAPMRARTKVYIIDEVHMLSKGAFNALLKILEEPPAHVCFLFATTEPHKVLDTILSRCQILRLSPLSLECIVARLDEVFASEGVSAEAGVTTELAYAARGGMRDALSQADKLLALAGDEPTLADLRRLGGEGGAREAQELLDHVENADRAALLRGLAAFHGDENELVDRLLEVLRIATVLAHCGAETPLVSLAGEERQSALARGERLGPERLELWMSELVRARERMRVLPSQERTLLELCLLDLSRSETTMPLSELVERLRALESFAAHPDGPRSDDGGFAPARPAPTPPGTPTPARPRPKPRTAEAPAVSPLPPAGAPAPPAEDRAEILPQPPPTPAPSPLASLWEPFLSELSRKHGALANVLRSRGGAASWREVESGVVHMELEDLQPDEDKLTGDRSNQRTCARVLSRLAGRALDFRLVSEAAGSRKTSGKAAAAAPKKDAFTHRVSDLFGGTIEDL
ncbi:MAG: DNA polymerase III, subunit gamma and tau [Planctomycetes bacterium]|jgi:DNA polymerase-3 subunit gamma/tau|nr:DNA polymerase III, subunit gamma and tau [Planctomycetota bacterium]